MLILLTLLPSAVAQINLGSFNFHPTSNGGWDLGMGQSANILGFGGDRGLQLGGGPGSFGLKGTGGALVAGERVGVDSGLGVQPGGGVDLGSQLNFGNNPNPMAPGGQFGSFLENIRRFFAGMAPPPPMPMPLAKPLPMPMFPTMSPSTTFATLRPNFKTDGIDDGVSGGSTSGEVETLSALDGDTETVDKLFERVTHKPRQLPGLVEFGEE